MAQALKIKNAEYAGDYKLRITFNDGKVNTFDYGPLVRSGHEGFSPFLDVSKFKKFKKVNCNTAIAWGNDWDMILPADMLHSKKTARFISKN